MGYLKSRSWIVVCALLWAGAAATALPAQTQSQTQDQPHDQSQPGSSTPAKTETPAGEQPPKEAPDAPGSANPVQQVEDKTKQVVDLTRDTARGELLRARDYESNRISGVYVGKSRPLVALSNQQRRQIYLHQTLTTPEAYVKRMFGAAVDQVRGTPSQWDDGWGGFAERWASREGQFITANTIAYLGNEKLGYEVRYDRCKCSGFGPRFRHALMRNFLTYNHTEKDLRPQLPLYAGAFTGGVLATTWKPSNQSYWKNGVYGVAGQAAYGTLLNFVTEFAVEINRKQGVH